MLSGKQLNCIRELVYTNKTQYQIAKELGVSAATLTNWTKKEEFQHELRKETDKKIGSLAQKAVRRLEKLVDSNNEGIALGACREILNKSGYKETEKVEQNTVLTLDVQVE